MDFHGRRRRGERGFRPARATAGSRSRPRTNSPPRHRRTAANRSPSDERATSPAVATVLLVAIVILLAALLGASSVGAFGAPPHAAPVTAFDVAVRNAGDGDPANDGVTVTLDGGDGLDGTAVTVTVGTVVIYDHGVLNPDDVTVYTVDDGWTDGRITAGDAIRFYELADSFDADDVLRITVTTADGRTVVLLERTVGGY